MTPCTLRAVPAALLVCLLLPGPALATGHPVAGYQGPRYAPQLGHPGAPVHPARPLSRREAAELVDRLIHYLERNPRQRQRLVAAPAPADAQLGREVSRLKAATAQNANQVSGVRDDLEFHLKKDRQEKEAPGRTRILGAGQISYTLTDEEASRSPILRFPYDWDQTPLSGVTSASGAGRGIFGVDFYKLGLETTFGPRYTLVGLLSAQAGGQANNSAANGFELGSPTFQGEALFVEVKELFDADVDMKAGYFWLPWGREVEGLQRLNPHFNSNSFYYQDGFSQAENQTGLYFQTHNASRIQYGFGVTTGDKEFSLPLTQAPGHTGNFAWQRPAAADNSDLGYYASVQGDYARFDWDVNYWDNGGAPGFFTWQGFAGGFSWGPHRRLMLEGELGHADIRQSTLARAQWEAGYVTAVWRLASDTDAAFRYDHATIRTAAGVTNRITTGRTLSISHRLDEKQRLIADFSNPISDPGFNPASPVLSPGRDIQDDLFKLSYRLVF